MPLLRVHLSEKEFAWVLNGEVPVLLRGNDRLYPIFQAHSRIKYGCAFDIGTFYQMAVWTADQAPFSAERVIDVELVEAGHHEKNVLYEDIETLLLTVVNGEEEYMILRSKDGFLQFFGMNDKKVYGIDKMRAFALTRGNLFFLRKFMRIYAFYKRLKFRTIGR